MEVPLMKARLIRIGNSRGIRIPKPLIEAAGLGDEVELRVDEGAIVIQPAGAPRAGWADGARRLQDSGEAGLLDDPTPTRFDEEDWRW